MRKTNTDQEIWKPEEYATYHKMVFRLMFDFLNDHFPPGENKEWWIHYAEDVEKAYTKAKGGPLVNGMLSAISDYLDEEYKKRRDEHETHD